MIYEDFVVGSSHALGAHRFTGEEIRRFALAYDPQPFHIDEEAAKASLFGAICASGWHTASVMMGLLSRYFARFDEQARSAGRPSAFSFAMRRSMRVSVMDQGSLVSAASQSA